MVTGLPSRITTKRSAPLPCVKLPVNDFPSIELNVKLLPDAVGAAANTTALMKKKRTNAIKFFFIKFDLVKEQ